MNRLPGYILLVFFFLSCSIGQPTCHETMIGLLGKARDREFSANNSFMPKAKLIYMDSLLSLEHNGPNQIAYCQYLKAQILLELGEEQQAIDMLENAARNMNLYQAEFALRELGIAYLRLAERSNCISSHAAESCLMPVRGLGVHRDTTGSRKAIRIYQKMVDRDKDDYESRWLLNLSYMTLGEYPEKVPPAYLLPGMNGDTTVKVNPFVDIAADLKLDTKNMAGGSITEDFNNDGYLDLFTTGWDIEENVHFFKNNADGTFMDMTEQAGLIGITGGLNCMQTDYNNDGYIDIFILRGGWKGYYGKEPNSLLRNNGDNTFTDVTTEAGLLSFHPTQTATWNDFDSDGWVDVFIGNEHNMADYNPSELYMNNGDGTFREVASKANCNVKQYVKGVTSGDYDHDGLKDIFISTMSNTKILLKNKGVQGGEVVFEDVTEQSGLNMVNSPTFPTWFWDYDNDGWLDLFVCDYFFKKSLAHYAAAEKLGVPAGSPDKMYLMHNNHDGTFTNKAREMGLNKVAFAMGSNFGDIDNDGFLDMYLGTGNPAYQSVVPNKMFKNMQGEKFADVTSSARVGHLQKGHGVSFADIDNDGDQDIHIDMGGAYIGDSYQNALFMNQNQGLHHWICIQLEGTESNRAAIGTSLKITFTEEGVARTIYRDVNSGGSFGASPLRREIGLGNATKIDKLEIQWHGSGKVETFTNIAADQFIKITEGENSIKPVDLKTINWILPEKLCLPLP
jgi:hypothetical protein